MSTVVVAKFKFLGQFGVFCCQSLDGHSGSPEIKLVEINGDHPYHHVRFPVLIGVQDEVKNSFLCLMCPMSFGARFSDKIVICSCAELVPIDFEKKSIGWNPFYL